MKKFFTHSFMVTVYDNGFCWKNPRWEEKQYTHFDNFLSNVKDVIIVILLCQLIT